MRNIQYKKWWNENNLTQNRLKEEILKIKIALQYLILTMEKNESRKKAQKSKIFGLFKTL